MVSTFGGVMRICFAIASLLALSACGVPFVPFI